MGTRKRRCENRPPDSTTKYSQRRLAGLISTPLTLPSDSASAVTTRNSASLPAGQRTWSASRYRRSSAVSSSLTATSPPCTLETARQVPATRHRFYAVRRATRIARPRAFVGELQAGRKDTAPAHWRRQRWIGHPANLLIHAQYVEAVPGFDDPAVFNSDQRDAPEVHVETCGIGRRPPARNDDR